MFKSLDQKHSMTENIGILAVCVDRFDSNSEICKGGLTGEEEGLTNSQ